MLLFNRCLWHNYEYWDTYHDCSDICMWSSGTSYYRQCKDCGHEESHRYYTKVWSADMYIDANMCLRSIYSGLRVINLSKKSPEMVKGMVDACNELNDYCKQPTAEQVEKYTKLTDELLNKIREQCPEYAI